MQQSSMNYKGALKSWPFWVQEKQWTPLFLRIVTTVPRPWPLGEVRLFPGLKHRWAVCIVSAADPLTMQKTDTVCSITHLKGRKNTSTTWISQTPVASFQCRVRENKILQYLKSWFPKRTLKRYLPFSLHYPWKCPLHRGDSEDKHSLVPQGKRTSRDQPWATDVQGEETYLPNYHQRQIKYRITAE